MTANTCRQYRMNPFGHKPSQFLVAEESDGTAVSFRAFGQVELKEPGVYELRSLVVDKAHR